MLGEESSTIDITRSLWNLVGLFVVGLWNVNVQISTWNASTESFLFVTRSSFSQPVFIDCICSPSREHFVVSNAAKWLDLLVTGI